MLTIAFLLALQACHTAAYASRNFTAIAKTHDLGCTVISKAYKKALRPQLPILRLDERLVDNHQEAELLKRLDNMAAKRLFPTTTIF